MRCVLPALTTDSCNHGIFPYIVSRPFAVRTSEAVRVIVNDDVIGSS